MRRTLSQVVIDLHAIRCGHFPPSELETVREIITAAEQMADGWEEEAGVFRALVDDAKAAFLRPSPEPVRGEHAAVAEPQNRVRVNRSGPGDPQP